MTAITRIRQYLHIHRNKIYIFERSIRESLEVFYPCVQKYYQNEIINSLVVNTYKYLTQFEPNFDKEIYLSLPPEICYERILERNRPGETITLEYLKELDNRY